MYGLVSHKTQQDTSLINLSLGTLEREFLFFILKSDKRRLKEVNLFEIKDRQVC